MLGTCCQIGARKPRMYQITWEQFDVQTTNTHTGNKSLAYGDLK